MNPIDPGAATASIIATWGAPGAIIVLLIIAVGWLAWWLYSSHKERVADLRADLEAKYKDAEETRDVLRELKGSIDLNTKTIETAFAVLKAKS